MLSQKLRDWVNHPLSTLGLIIALEWSSRLTARLPWLTIPRMALWLWLCYSSFNSLFPRKSAPEASGSRTGLPWRPIAYVLGMIFIALILAYFRSDNTRAMHISPQPLQAIAAIGSPEVVLGADEMTIYQDHRYDVGTISYYTADGLAVGMAHLTPGLELGTYWVALRSVANTDRQSAQLIANDNAGIVLKLDRLPDALSQRVVIGSLEDITVGEVAQVYSVRGGSFPVRVLGYDLRKGIQSLVIQPLDKSDSIIPGMSGSPVVQNGKLIGCVSSTLGLFHRGPVIGLARLAADIYASTSPPSTSP